MTLAMIGPIAPQGMVPPLGAEWRVAASMLRDRLAKREHIADLKVKMAECAGNVVDLQSRMLGTTRRVIEATTEWLASNPPALRSEQKGNPI